ncbi:hypothetical protein QR680_000361 [Steinernema hermaphroditum]|uniref:F-box domain-containing protein n=1 Tax=Steinernema hermaphroditum TaxID=289476 RepID=A0AA39GVV6_9BILA|nr:hypothetical protein QR680_000361 [Steinernema hermaphroditum]
MANWPYGIAPSNQLLFTVGEIQSLTLHFVHNSELPLILDAAPRPIMLLLEPDGSRLELWWYDVKSWFNRKRTPQGNRLIRYVSQRRSESNYKKMLKRMEKDYAWFNKRREPAIEQQSNDILMMIFGLLDFDEMLNCRFVCHAFNDVIVDNLRMELGLWVRKHNRSTYMNCITATTTASLGHLSNKCQLLPSRHLRRAHSHLTAYQLTLESGACDKSLLDTLDFPVCRNIKMVNWKSGFMGGDNRKRFFETKVLQKSVTALRIAENSVCLLEELVGFLAGPNVLMNLDIDYGGVYRMQLADLIVEMFTLGEHLQEFKFISRNNDFETSTGLVVQFFQIFFNQTQRVGEVRLPSMSYRGFIQLKKYLNNQFEFEISETSHKSFSLNLVSERSLIVTNDPLEIILSCLRVIG